MDLKSINDLPVASALADGDYLVTVSGGQAKLLPAGDFSGGGGGKVTVYDIIITGGDTTIAYGNLQDADGVVVSDPAVFREALLGGSVVYRFNAGQFDPSQEGIYYYLQFSVAIIDYTTGLGITLVMDSAQMVILIGTIPE